MIVTNQIIVAIISGIIGSAGTVWLQAVKNKGESDKAKTSNEGIYAEHTSELLDRLDKVISERDDLKAQVMDLRQKVEDQSRVINELTTQIQGLRDDMEANK